MNSEEKDKVIEIQIEEEMKKSYIDYAMSVIVGRALPDVRDGLKPVHRRILYAMNDLGLYPEKAYRKSATVVGEVLGKYHPHGDASVYDAMVKMAQDFSMRKQLVDGHGNFGSVDGDSAAAMRYTEAKLSKLAMELLRDIDKETVAFAPNYDESREEPTVLPAKYPNLLVNGSNGIAVGMATSIPPHNLGEVIDGVVSFIDNPEISIPELVQHIKGPDFPTGGIILGKNDMEAAYQKGRGRVRVRAKAEIEETNKGRERIVITEIPYQVNKARLIEKIADLVKDKRIEGISDLRDESNRQGMRIVVDLKRDVNSSVVLNQLYKHTQLEDTYSIIMLSLVNGEPKVLNLKQMIYHYVEHQKEIITRRTKFDLKKAQDRAHILEGLKIALDNLDEVIKIIRGSSDGQVAKEELIGRFALSEPQAQAILDMRLQRLTGLERGKIETEYNELMDLIKSLQEILASEQMLMGIIKGELNAVKEKFADKRRTKIRAVEEEINIEDLIEDEEIAITLTHLGYIKRVTSDTYKSQRRGGKGISALSTREADFVEHLVTTTTHSRVLFFTNKGRVYRIKAYEIPEGKRQAKGMALVNIIPLEKDEKVTAIIPYIEAEAEKYLLLCTKKGIMKKTLLSEFRKSKRNGLIAINLRDDDELIGVKLTDGYQEIMLVTRKGMSIRFSEQDIRPMGRSAMGVKAMTIPKDDELVSISLVGEGDELLVVSEKGFGKRTLLDEYRLQSRGGKGIKTYNVNEKTGFIAGSKTVNTDDELMIISSDGVLIRLKVEGISQFGRATSGVKLMKTEEDAHIVSIAKILADEDEE